MSINNFVVSRVKRRSLKRPFSLRATPHLISGLDFTILPKTYTGIHFQTRYFRGRYRRPCDRRGTIYDVDRQAFM